MADHNITERRTHVLDARLSETTHHALVERADRWLVSRSEAADTALYVGCAFLDMLDHCDQGVADLVSVLNRCAEHLGTPLVVERRSGQDRRRRPPSAELRQVGACQCCHNRFYDHLPAGSSPGEPARCAWCVDHCLSGRHIPMPIDECDPPAGYAPWMVQDSLGRRIDTVDTLAAAMTLATEHTGTAWRWGVAQGSDRPAEWHLVYDATTRVAAPLVVIDGRESDAEPLADDAPWPLGDGHRDRP